MRKPPWAEIDLLAERDFVSKARRTFIEIKKLRRQVWLNTK